MSWNSYMLYFTIKLTQTPYRSLRGVLIALKTIGG